MEYIIAFTNTNFAIKAERSILDRNLCVSVMPLPSQIRAGCGICLRVPAEEIERVLTVLDDRGITEISLFSRMENNSNGYIYQEIDVNLLKTQEN